MSLAADLAELRALFAAAMKVELTTIPLYATACYTIADHGAPGAVDPASPNAEAAELLRQVMLEEMLHLTLAANLLNAIGGRPCFDRAEAIPDYPCHVLPGGRGPRAHLRRFAPAQVRVFREIERAAPEEAPCGDCLAAETIGGFYRCVERKLDALLKTHRAREVFVGDPARQVGPEHYWSGGGAVIRVTDARSARRALSEIVEEGEGAEHGGRAGDDDPVPGTGAEDVAHWFKFDAILRGRRYRPEDRIGAPPTGEGFAVDWAAVHRMRDDPRAEDFAHLPEVEARMIDFDLRYTRFLLTLQAAFDGAPERMREAGPMMMALRDAAVSLCRIPVNEAGETAGPGWRFRP